MISLKGINTTAVFGWKMGFYLSQVTDLYRLVNPSILRVRKFILCVIRLDLKTPKLRIIENIISPIR